MHPSSRGVRELRNLTWVDLSLNAISGSLPAEFGDIQNIEVLSLAHNRLQGQIFGFSQVVAFDSKGS